MTEEQKKKYEEDIKGCGNLDYPLVGCILTPICKICKNYDLYGTWISPTCKVLGAIPMPLKRCDSYSCPEFIHDENSIDNVFFDENFQPKNKYDD